MTGLKEKKSRAKEAQERLTVHLQLSVEEKIEKALSRGGSKKELERLFGQYLLSNKKAHPKDPKPTRAIVVSLKKKKGKRK